MTNDFTAIGVPGAGGPVSETHARSERAQARAIAANAADLSSNSIPLASLALDGCLFDTSRFPLVRLRPRAVRPGYAFAWSAQMKRLVALSTPFVLVAEQPLTNPTTTRACVGPGCVRTARRSRRSAAA